MTGIDRRLDATVPSAKRTQSIAGKQPSSPFRPTCVRRRRARIIMRPSIPSAAALLSLGLLALARAGWVDPDTPGDKQTAQSYKEGECHQSGDCEGHGSRTEPAPGDPLSATPLPLQAASSSWSCRTSSTW
jgi:hypothetical protein